ncbi:phospho-sugar mutase [Peredibacter starrii]|uniref:Phospho-sugar mutase n=1 Tax=Peredibacter starrii TaxID=28202 RepID=A0AAX4HMZ5_9BACT|nr:phospho-sugar mutase [Peredibacter starrii]WPU64575.1 phospho-sugar mutase [Peredibacter starrii]
MDQKIIQNATLWGNNTYFSEADRQEIQKLLADLPKNELELTERFYRDLEFGTGGLRAPMGMGQNRMNRYNVRRATQALANNIMKHFNGGSAVISYDSRNCSKEFALEAAGVFAANGIKAYVFRALTPTPMLSYGVRYYKAQAGIMITASHNPPIYNGFKAFWNDGAQVVPPVDKEIINQYNELTDWNNIKYMPFEEAEKKGLAVWTDEKVENAFYEVIEKKVIQDMDFCKKHGGELSIVYTALHGSAEVPCNVTAKRLGFTNFYSIPEQAKPDGNFPTVKSPNPEDPKALAMAIDYMLKNNGDIVYGTDPDGDRLGVVVNDHGKPAILNGNQIAALMLYYVFFTKVEKKTLPEKALVIKSIVTSPIQNAIVEHFGGTVMDTLTGFKWMAGLIRDLEVQKSPYNFVFASEESFGYMPHNESRDKDGVSSMALMSEVALYYKRKNMSLVDALDEIYAKFGFFYESLVSLDYEGIEGAKKIGRIMEFFRHYPETQFAGEEIVGKEDYEASISSDIRLKSNKAIALPKSNVLSFSFASGNKLFLRPSGTEPKIKFYTMVRETEGDLAAKKLNALKKVKIIEDKIKEFCEKA